MDSVETTSPAWYSDLKAVQDKHDLWMLTYTKDDAEQAGWDGEADANPELTDEEWDTIRHRMDKAIDYIAEQAGGLLSELVGDVLAERNAARLAQHPNDRAALNRLAADLEGV